MSRRGLIDLRASPVTWTPANLSNLVAWYKADTQVYKDLGSTLCSNNDTVEQWNDQSGSGYNITQTASGNRPTFLSAGYNSKQAVSFTASSNTYLSLSSFAGLNSATVCSWFFVGQMASATASFGRALSYTSGVASDYNNAGSIAAILRDGTNNGIACYYNSSEFSTDAISTATNYRLGMIFDATHSTPYVNNVAGTQGNVSFTLGSNGILVIGNYSTAFSSGWQGPISEIVITKSAMTSTDRNNLDSYFTGKWGT